MRLLNNTICSRGKFVFSLRSGLRPSKSFATASPREQGLPRLFNNLKLFLAALSLLAYSLPAWGAPTVQLELGGPIQLPAFSSSIQLFLFLASISLIPFFLISVTSFIRIVVVFAILRTAIGTQQVPPNPVIIGLAVFMTVFIMTPVWQQAQVTALIPFQQGKITELKALERGFEPVRAFMLKQTRQSDLSLFIHFSKIPPPKNTAEVPTHVLIPAFMISELKTAFQIGFVLFVPFLIIDLVIANILLSLGMFMLSPVIVSLPFKILLFILADGWQLITQGLMASFS